ncbi:hypothetical protein AVEN_200227-1, partial [Araneus ventricosus]
EVRPVINDNTVNQLHRHYWATTGRENLLIYEKASYPRAGRGGLVVRSRSVVSSKPDSREESPCMGPASR